MMIMVCMILYIRYYLTYSFYSPWIHTSKLNVDRHAAYKQRRGIRERVQRMREREEAFIRAEQLLAEEERLLQLSVDSSEASTSSTGEGDPAIEYAQAFVAGVRLNCGTGEW